MILLCRLRSTLIQILEALQPLQKLLELLNPRFDSVLRHTFELGRLSRVTAPSGTTVSGARVGSALGSAGGYLNAAGTAGNLLLPGSSGKEAALSLKNMPGLSKGLRRARDEHGGEHIGTVDSQQSIARSPLPRGVDEFWGMHQKDDLKGS